MKTFRCCKRLPLQKVLHRTQRAKKRGSLFGPHRMSSRRKSPSISTRSWPARPPLRCSNRTMFFSFRTVPVRKRCTSSSRVRLASSELWAAQQSIGGDVADDTKIQLLDPVRPRLERLRPELLEPYPTEETLEGPDLRAHWRAIQKRRWTILSILLVVFTFALIVTWKQKAVYRADALLEIQKENANIPTVQELFQLENVSDNYLETQYKVLQSETLARRVIDE